MVDTSSLSGIKKASRRPVIASRATQVPSAIARAEQNVSYNTKPTATSDARLRAVQENSADNIYNRRMLDGFDLPADDGGSGRRGGGGGGGGPAFNFQGQIDFLRQLLAGGKLKPNQRTFTPDSAIRRRLEAAVAGDRGAANQSYDQLDQFLGQQAGQQNAYEAMPEVAGGSRGVDLSALLGSQGGDPRAASAMQGALGAEASQGADVFNRLIDTLGANDRSSMGSRQSESAMARAFAQRSIDSQQLAGNTTLDLRDAERKRQIEDANFMSTEQGRQAELQLAQQIAQIAAEFGIAPPSLAELGL